MNGNTAVGIEGSIPPAEGIEFDQREIVAVIKYAADNGFSDFANALCQPPANTDLTQLLKAIFGIFNSTKLNAPKTYYVNTATGNDSNNGLTPTSAFKTIQRAANQASFYNLNGFSVTINVADGVYGRTVLPAINGTGTIYLIGNTSVPANCVIHANQGSAIQTSSGPYALQGFRYESDTNMGDEPGAGVWATPGSTVIIWNVNEFGNCSDAHMYASQGSISISGSVRICGNGMRHVVAQNGSWVYTGGIPKPTLIIPAAQAITYFAEADASGAAQLVYSTMSGKANITGTRYLAQLNGVINTAGAGITYLPGTIAGVTNTGGQYS